MNQSPSVGSLFQTAHQEGTLSKRSLQALTVQDLGAEIQAGLGIPVNTVTASEVVLVTIEPDDSGSIRFSGNSQAVRDGHNLVIDALLASKQEDSVLFGTRYLNGLVLNPYRPLQLAVRMDTHNYDPNLGTPLFDQTIITLGTVLAKTQEFADNGVPVRSVTLIMTDGQDLHSTRSTAKDVASVIKDMLMTETHIVAAIGIDNGDTDYQRVFREMGIPDEWILTPANTPTEIRKAFAVFSKSAVRASQNVAMFSQTALGGFVTE